MCTSDASNIPFVVSELQRLRPHSVLDVGIGFGKLGVLVREYLECWYGRCTPDAWQIQLEGIESFDGYRNALWSSMYNRVHVGDARLLVDELPRFDVAVCCDVIEHMDKPSGLALLRALAGKCQTLLLTTPISFWAQGAENGNPYEIHRSLWTPDDLHGFDGRVVQLGSTFGATLTRPPEGAGRIRVQQRYDHVGVRPLARALLRRGSVLLSRRDLES
jgi:hypothetical protein